MASSSASTKQMEPAASSSSAKSSSWSGLPQRVRLVLYQGASSYRLSTIHNEYDIEQKAASSKVFEISKDWWLAVALEVDGKVVPFKTTEHVHLTIADLRDPSGGTKRLYHSTSTTPWKADGFHYFGAIEWLQRGTYRVIFDLVNPRKQWQVATAGEGDEASDFHVEPLSIKVRVEDTRFYESLAATALKALPESLALVIPAMRRRLAYPTAKLTKREREWLLAEKERLLGRSGGATLSHDEDEEEAAADTPSLSLSNHALADLAERMAEKLETVGTKDIEVLARFFKDDENKSKRKQKSKGDKARGKNRNKGKHNDDDDNDDDNADGGDNSSSSSRNKSRDGKRKRAALLASLTAGGIVGGQFAMREEESDSDGGNSNSDSDAEDNDEDEGPTTAGGLLAALSGSSGPGTGAGAASLVALLTALKGGTGAGAGRGAGALFFSSSSSAASTDRFGNPTVAGSRRLVTLDDWVNYLRLRPLYDKMQAAGELNWKLGGGSSSSSGGAGGQVVASSASSAAALSSTIAPAAPANVSAQQASQLLQSTTADSASGSSGSFASAPLPLQLAAEEESELPGCPDTCSSTALPTPLATVLKNRKRKRKPEQPLRLTDAAHYHQARADAEDFVAMHSELKAIELSCLDQETGKVDLNAFKRRLMRMRSRVVTITPTTRRCHRHDAFCAGKVYLHFHRSQMRPALFRQIALGAAVGVSLTLNRTSRAFLHYIRMKERSEKRNLELIKELAPSTEELAEPAEEPDDNDGEEDDDGDDGGDDGGRATLPSTADSEAAANAVVDVATAAANARKKAVRALFSSSSSRRAGAKNGNKSTPSSSASVPSSSSAATTTALPAAPPAAAPSSSPVALPPALNGAIFEPSPCPLTEKQALGLLAMGIPGKREAKLYPLLADALSLAEGIHKRACEADLESKLEARLGASMAAIALGNNANSSSSSAGAGAGAGAGGVAKSQKQK